jgi:hypothetical protein
MTAAGAGSGVGGGGIAGSTNRFAAKRLGGAGFSAAFGRLAVWAAALRADAVAGARGDVEVG